MPKPPPVAFLIHDDDDASSGSHDSRRESRPVVGMGGQGERFGGSERRREAARSPPPRRNQLAPSSPATVRAGATASEAIELDDGDDDERYEVPSEVQRVVKTEPVEDSGSESADSPARGRKRAAAASAPGGSRKAKKRRQESPVRRSKPHRDESSGAPPKKVKSAEHSRHGHKGSDRGRHDAGQASTVVASRSWNGEGREVASAAKYSAPVGSDDSEDDDYHYSPDESNGSPAKVKSAGRRRRGHKGGGSDWRGSAPARQVGPGVSSRTRSRNGDRGKGASAAKYLSPLLSDHSGDDHEMDEVRSDDNRRSRDNEEEDVVKGKNKVDDNGDSEEMYKSAEEEETGGNGNGIHDESYAGVEEEDSDDTAEPEDEERGEEDDESNEAGEEVPGTPSSNAEAGGNDIPAGDDRPPPVGTKIFEGLCLIDQPDNTVGEGISKRTRLQRGCSDKKLLTQGTLSNPYCIKASDSEPEEEEGAQPPVQTEQAQPSDGVFEDDSGGDNGVPRTKKRRRQQQFSDSDDSDSEDSSDDSDSESDRPFARNARKGPSSNRPMNGGASYRQQHTAKEGCKDYAGSSNPPRVKSYAANAGKNPTDRGGLQQGDVSFKKSALLPQKGKRGGPSGEKNAYDDLFNSIFDEVEKHPNGSAPAQPKQVWDDRYPLVFSFGDEDEVDEEKTEHDLFMEDLWAHRDFVMETVIAEEGEGSNAQEIPAKKERLCIEGMEHDFYLDEQIGIICRHCKFIKTEIRHVYPDVVEWSDSEERERELREERALDHALRRYLKEDDDMLASIGREGERISIDSSHKSGPVWDLVPAGVRENMFPHQREAFEFMWTKLAGGTNIEKVNKMITADTSGCVVSHAPGTGKTRLAIVFVQSYLELFPRCSPLILAPKGMLATWRDEFRKWNSKVPFHVLNSRDIHWDEDKTIQRLAANDDDLKRKLLDKALNKKFRRHLKFLSWFEGNSVIGISYSQFRNLTKEGGSDDDAAARIRKLLLQRPDLLVLDEGHIPRTRNSRIYKALDQVRTRKRIILSGTPFQNSFEELHSTLCLLRAGDADPSFWTSLSLNNVTDERINEIRKKLDPFVHIHNGDVLNKALPGLRESVVILNPLPMQKKIIEMMEKSETENVSGLSKRKSVFRFEHRISLASVHPSLLTSMSNLPEEVVSMVDEPSLQKIRLKPSEGVKASFVYEIVCRCLISKERVIVFSQFLETLDLIMEQLISLFNWTRDKEVLLMTGEVKVETRQPLIMAFNDMNSDAKVMLASTKACGEGIQLTGASRVVLLDVVWNPSVGRQAIGRAYRIGQQKIVYTYNLIAEGTQEKSKYDRQAKKDHMSKMLFSNESQPAQCNQLPESIFHDSILEDMTEDENLKEMFVNILPSQ